MENRAVGDSIGEKAECKCDVFTWFRNKMLSSQITQSSQLFYEREESVIDIRPDLPLAEWPEPCIYRVPKQLRKVKDQAYTPKQVSIGPFHHGLQELKDMEEHKLRYLEDFLKRVTVKNQDLERIIGAKEKEIRHCYSEDDYRLESDEFVNMILLDAIFIIELFLKVKSINEARKKGEKAEEEKNDYILSKPWLANGICYDLILLENQLPFFVLDDLYTSAFNDSSGLSHQQEGQQIKEHQGDLNKEVTPFLKLSRCFFFQYDIDKQQKSNIGREVKHFTDLLRYFFCPPKLKPTGDQYSVYSATKLDEAGLQFKAFKEDERRLLDIRFPENKCLKNCPCFNLSWLLACLPCFSFSCLERMQCILKVPPFVVDDHTECLLRNIMALEQCYYPRQAYVCNYVRLLDYLINTEEDVALLVDEKVIINELGSNVVVANLINNLCDEIVLDGTCYSSLAKKLNDYRDNPWNRNMASMTSVYFRDFWRGTTTVVGLIVLGLTIWNFFK